MPAFGPKIRFMFLLMIVAAYGWVWIRIYYGPQERDFSPQTVDFPAATMPAAAAVELPSHPSPTPKVDPKRYHCHKTARPIKVTGRGNDSAWRLAEWTDFFVDIEGDKKARPRFLTRAKMLWSEQCLYVYAELEEPDLWATITEKNAVIFHDNDFEVFIDPDGHGENYYEYEMNALNTIWELTLPKRYSQGGRPILGTNLPGLVSAVYIDGTFNNPGDVDHGWSAEIAFPFSGLAIHRREGACPPVAGDNWRINFSRVEWSVQAIGDSYQKIARKPEDNWVWSPQGLVDMHQPEHWGCVEFDR